MLVYLILINAAAFVLMCLDKYFAKHDMWRIPEATLLDVAAIGGSLGALVAMYTVRHKTRHKKFTVTLPVLVLAHAYLYVKFFA